MLRFIFYLKVVGVVELQCEQSGSQRPEPRIHGQGLEDASENTRRTVTLLLRKFDLKCVYLTVSIIQCGAVFVHSYTRYKSVSSMQCTTQ